LRARLLAVQGDSAARRPGIEPRSIGDDPGSSWFLASPLAPMAASFLIVAAVGIFMGNPYRVAAESFARVQDELSPAAARLRQGASHLAGAAAGVGEAAGAVLPRAGRRVSRAIAGTIQHRLGDQEAPPVHPRVHGS
jgi:hypothetical protein